MYKDEDGEGPQCRQVGAPHHVQLARGTDDSGAHKVYTALIMEKKPETV